MQSCSHGEDYAGCIYHVPIFGSLNQREILEVAGISSIRNVGKGEMVYRAGDECRTLFVLYTGRVKLFRIGASGREQVLHVIGPGEFIGELSLFSSLPLTDNAQALDDCVLCVIQGAKLKELMGRYPSIAFKVMDDLSRRLEKAESRIEAISLSPAAQRVAGALLELASEGNEIHLPMTKGDLASQIGMTQETLSRQLAELQNGGLIELKGYKKIIINNKSKLEDLSSTE